MFWKKAWQREAKHYSFETFHAQNDKVFQGNLLTKRDPFWLLLFAMSDLVKDQPDQKIAVSNMVLGNETNIWNCISEHFKHSKKLVSLLVSWWFLVQQQNMSSCSSHWNLCCTLFFIHSIAFWLRYTWWKRPISMVVLCWTKNIQNASRHSTRCQSVSNQHAADYSLCSHLSKIHSARHIIYLYLWSWTHMLIWMY